MKSLKQTTIAASSLCLLGAGFLAACGGGPDEEPDGETEADRLGVAATCEEDLDCPEVEIDEETVQLQCLLQFDGGYCAIEDCESALDCPEGSTCVAHDDGKNYCFRECVDKAECNANRGADEEANCSANFDYADAADDNSGVKACIPPSSGG
jgi:hypothetical protein